MLDLYKEKSIKDEDLLASLMDDLDMNDISRNLLITQVLKKFGEMTFQCGFGVY